MGGEVQQSWGPVLKVCGEGWGGGRAVWGALQNNGTVPIGLRSCQV